MSNKENKSNNLGTVKISDEVIAIACQVAIKDIDGVICLKNPFSISEMLGKKNQNKGVKCNITEDKVLVDISVVISYGININDVALKIQENVKKEIETITSLTVTKVNVLVADIKEKEEKKEITKED